MRKQSILLQRSIYLTLALAAVVVCAVVSKPPSWVFPVVDAASQLAEPSNSAAGTKPSPLKVDSVSFETLHHISFGLPMIHMAGFGYDPQDRPVAAWSESSSNGGVNNFRWSRRENNVWIETTMDQPAGGIRAAQADFVLRADGTPFFAYAIRDAFIFGQEWYTAHIVDLSAQPMGHGVSVQPIEAGQSCIAAYPKFALDFAPGAASPSFLLGTHCSFSGWLSLDNATIHGAPPFRATAGTGGEFHSIDFAVGPAGSHHVTYYSERGGPNWGAYYSNGSPGHEFLLTVPHRNRAAETSIAVGTDGRIHVAIGGVPLCDNTFEGGLLYLSSTDGVNWTRAFVDETSGRNPSIELDAAGNPHIAYWRNHTQVRLASLNAGAWQSTPIYSATASVGRPSVKLAFDAAGDPHVLFFNPDTNDISVSSGLSSNTPPAATNPNTQTSPAGETISLQIVANDPESDVLSYSSCNLPPGLSINSSSGLISGTIPVATPPGSYDVTVVASDTVGNAASLSFRWIITGAATKLAVVVQPTNAATLATITPAVQIAVQDAAGNTVTSATNGVTIAIGNNAGGSGVLAGTLTRNAVNGVATFDDLSLDRTGIGYTLTSSAAGLTSATSDAFDITTGAAASLAFLVQPTNAGSTVTISPAIQVAVQDAAGNTVTDATTAVTIAIGNNAGGDGVLAGTLTRNAINGIATFDDLSLDRSATGYTLAASSAGLVSATSNAFDITSGAAAKLGLIAQPGNTAALATISPAVQVAVQDASGNTVTDATNAVTIGIGNNAGGSGVLTGTLTRNAINGIATFDDLRLNRTGTGYTLAVSAAGLTSATSTGFDINPGAAAKLAFIVQPANTAALAPISPAVQVVVQDAAGNTVAEATNGVTMAISNNAGGSGVLSGTLMRNPANGIAKFDDLSLDRAATGYTLAASAVGLTSATSEAFDIAPGVAAKLSVIVQPVNAVAQATIAPSIQVAVQDGAGNNVATATNAVSIAIGNNAGGNGTLSGTLTRNSLNGIATFDDLSLNRTGTGYTLTVSADGLASASSEAFDIAPGPGAKLSFSVQPVNTVALATMTPAVQVAVQDTAGNTVTDASNAVTIDIGNNAGGSGVLSGTLTRNAVNGIASFDDLGLDRSATGYTLVISAAGLTSATSNAFDITPGAPAKLAFIVQPADTAVFAPITPAVQVVIQDDAGNTTTDATNAVTVSIDNNPAGNAVLSGTLTRTAVNGIVSFDDLSLDQAGVSFTLRMTASGLTPVISGSFNISRPTIIVTKTADTNDGACDADCSLREAITAANIINGADVINFNISGTSPFSITLGSVLPDISSPVTIDATTQAGFGGSPIVGLNRANQTINYGLKLSAGNSIVRGLRIGGFASNNHSAIVIESSNNVISGNFVGIDFSGTTNSSNHTGISINSGSDNVVGGLTPADRNIISGNGTGVQILSADNQVIGNYIGTNASGSAAIPSSGTGVDLRGSNNTVGNATPAGLNLLSGNTNGIRIAGNGNIIQGNQLGRNATNTGNVNSGSGIILVSDASMNLIGGTTPGTGNVLTNLECGIKFLYPGSPKRNLIRGNSIFANSQLGITLTDSYTARWNDPGDADSGANELQNYPGLNRASVQGNDLTIQGELNSTPNSTYTLEFFSNQSCDASGYGEGQTPLGTATATTGASGITGFRATFPAANAPVGSFITATATDADNNTSEFSQCREVGLGYSISGRLYDSAGNVPVANTEVLIYQSGRSTPIDETVTDSQGYYAFHGVVSGDYRVFPSPFVEGVYSWGPSERTYNTLGSNQDNQDFVGTRDRYTVRVEIKANDNGELHPLGQVLVQSSPVGGNKETDANGVAIFHPYISAGPYTFTPISNSHVFSPPSVTLPNPLTSDMTVEFTAQTPYELPGRFLVSNHSGPHTLNADGTSFTMLEVLNPRYPSHIGDLDLSRDGHQIVYYLVTGSGGGPQIRAGNFDGSANSLVSTIDGLLSLRQSPDKNKVGFVRDLNNRSEIWLRTELGVQSFLTTASTQRWSLSNLAWAPDSTRIAFKYYSHLENLSSIPVANRPKADIYSINIDGTNLLRLTSTTDNDFDPDWSPDGTKIVFVRGVGNLYEPHSIIGMNANGGSQTPLYAANNKLSTPMWSPDGSKIAFLEATGQNTSRLMVIDADGSNPLHLRTDSLGGLSWGLKVQAATAAGSNIEVQSGAVSLNFSQITGSGATTVSPIPANSAGQTPGGFVIAGLAYEVSTTAAYTAPVSVCFAVPATIGSTVADFDRLNLMHNENGTLVNRTTSRNFVTRQICGSVDSLSPFALAEQIDASKPQIFGLVVDSNGNPMSGVKMLLTGTENKETETSTDGTFKFVNLTTGANYNVQPQQLGYVFSSYSQDFVNVSGEQPVVFTGSASSFPISGQVTDQQGNGVEGTLIQVEGATATQAITDANGNYTISDLPAAGSYTLRAINGGDTFSPSEILVGPLASNVTDVDFTLLTPTTPTAADASVSGRVVDDKGGPVAGVVISLSGTQDRKTVTGADGNYRFDSVETNGFYTVTPMRANYQFSPLNLSFSLLANVTDAVFTATPDSVNVGNVIDTPEYFVRQHYLDFLGREPDESGFNFWTNQMLECGTDAACLERRRINVSAAYFLSIEFQETGGLVDGLYRASYGRRPLYAEFMPDAAIIAQNVVVGQDNWQQRLTANKQTFLQSFISRAAFREVYDGLSNEVYVDQLISHTKVNFSDIERNALVNGLNNNALTRADVLLRIAENAQFMNAKRNAAFVMMEYFGYLRRDPDESGYQFWLNKLNQFDGNFERAEMVKAFISSDEYRQRFAQ